MLMLLVLLACPHPVVVRDARAYTVEVAAALARQEEAAAVLRKAAESASLRGEVELCRALAGPALLIEAVAEVQARRSLWLAGLEPVDPGPTPAVAPVTSICPGEDL